MNKKYNNLGLNLPKEESLDLLNDIYLDSIKSEYDNLSKSFIGKNYEKIINNKFNIHAFLFDDVYYFYRKMYLYAFVIIIIKMLLLLFATTTSHILIVYFILLLILKIIIGYTTNYVYLRYAKDQIKKLFNVYSSNKIEKQAIKKGGTNKKATIILFIIKVLFILLVIVSLVYCLFLNKPKKQTPKKEFDGKINKKYVEDNVFDFEFPTSWDMNGSTASKKYDNGSCKASIYEVLGYKDKDKFIDDFKKFYGINLENKITVDKITWTNIQDNNKKIKYYYITEKSKHVYVYEFDMSSSVMSETCSEIKTHILSTIKYKEFE